MPPLKAAASSTTPSMARPPWPCMLKRENMAQPNQLAELFATSVPYINIHISNMLVKKGWARIQLLRVF